MSDPLGIASEIGANDMVTPETEKKNRNARRKKTPLPHRSKMWAKKNRQCSPVKNVS
jgi:hypothetical protein